MRLGVAAAAGLMAVVFGVVSPGSGVDRTTGADSGGQEPLVSLRMAAAQTSTAAEDSGRAVVRITKDARPWAGKTVVWNGDDIGITEDAPARPAHAAPVARPGKVNREIRVVDGIVYMPNSGQLPPGRPTQVGRMAAAPAPRRPTPDRVRRRPRTRHGLRRSHPRRGSGEAHLATRAADLALIFPSGSLAFPGQAD